MEIRAKSKYIRISPRKLRLVADSLRGLKPKQAIVLLEQSGKKAGGELLETLKQAIANAENNFHLKVDDLKIKKLQVDEGPIYKRFRAISRGMAHPIKKRTSHIVIVLETMEGKMKNGKLKMDNKEKTK